MNFSEGNVMVYHRFFLVLCCFVALFSEPVLAQSPETLLAPGSAVELNPQVSTEVMIPLPHLDPAAALPLERKVLQVALKPAPPFVIPEGDHWSGLAVELWGKLAKALNLKYVYQPYQTIEEVLNAVEQGDADLAIGAISVTSSREGLMDFTQPFFQGGIGIVTVKQAGSIWSSLVTMFSLDLIRALVALSTVLFVFGLMIWFFERKKNQEQFGGSALNGIGQGFWWSAVTMTTVGYGDKSPVTFWGRAVALIWMFASVISISGFTAAIASSITLSHLQSRINGVSDLPDVRVAGVRKSASSIYLSELHIHHQDFARVEDALDALELGERDAVIYDLPILRYLVPQRHNDTLVVLPDNLHTEHYAFLLPQGSDLREAINQALLQYMDSSEWTLLQESYFNR